MKKSKVLKSAGIGFLIAGSIGLLFCIASDGEGNPLIALFYGAYLGVVAGAPVGALAGIVEGRDTTIQIEEMTDSEIQEALDYLRKKARVRNYK